MSIKHDHTLNPVTALEFYYSGNNNLLLCGEGSCVKIFDTTNFEYLAQFVVLEGQTIHGVCVNQSADQDEEIQVVIWGGSNLVLLSQRDIFEILDQKHSSVASRSITVSDWILSVATSSHERSSCLLITAHNTLLKVEATQLGSSPSWKHLPSPSESILYSAQVIWDTQDRVLVAAGTAFGEILVWELMVSDQGKYGTANTLFTFSGHEGSIFGVNFSPCITFSDGKINRLLASCSDDRTIRVWDLSQNAERAELSKETLLRETGFGKNEASDVSDISSSRCLAIAMGHASRIWGVRFLVGHIESGRYRLRNLGIISFGEDSTAQQWAFSLKTGTSELKLTQTNAFAFHSGKHIWSAALDNADHGCHTIATGGADGKISLYSLTVPDGSFALSKTTTGQYSAPELPYNDKYQHDLDERDLADVLHRLTSPDGGVVDPLEEPTEQPPTSPPSILLPNGGKAQIKKTKKVAKDGWNRYAFVSQDQFLVTTNFGRVFLSETNPDLKFSEITFPDSDKADLRSYSILKGFPEISRAFLAGSNGNIHVFESGIISKIGKIEGKPADMFKIYDKKTASFELLITTLSASVASLFPISHDSVADEMPIKKVDYTLHDDFVVTSGAMCDSLLILGSRKGSLAVYSSPDGPDFILDGQYGFGGDAVTSILQLPELIRSQGKAYFLSTGRNGTYVIFALHFVHIQGNVKPTDLYPVHRGTPPFGPMVESAWFEGSDLMLCGFKSKNFVVWNATKQHEVLNVECGGAHRSYAYSTIQRAGDKTLFIYTKASKLCVHSQSNASHDVVKTGGHGREIKSCTISPNQEFFATGAEDTTIRIWKYDEKGLQRSSGFSCLSIIHQHTAGIQHLHWYDSKYLLSSGGNEEFFIWAIEEIPGFGVGVICEAMCPDQSEDRDLRIMSFDVTTAPGPLIIGGNSTLLISLAYSDSTIRIYTYDRVSSFTLIGTGKYTSSCLTQIEHISLTESTLHILTGSTDGSLVTWKLPFQPQSHDENEENSYHPSPPRLEMVSRAKIHQNAIKSLAFSRAAGIQFLLVVTGGDDNALAISIYPENMLTAKPMTFILRSAHAAAITGVCVSPEPSTRGHSLAFRLVSSGNDQIVKEWVIIVYGGNAGRYGVNIEKVGDVHTCVADVGDIANLRNNSKTKKGKILVVGNGMEVWDVDMGKISAANDSSETG